MHANTKKAIARRLANGEKEFVIGERKYYRSQLDYGPFGGIVDVLKVYYKEENYFTSLRLPMQDYPQDWN